MARSHTNRLVRMKVFSKFKKHLPARSKKNSTDAPNGKDKDSSPPTPEPRSVTPVPGQPTASGTIASQNIDPWLRAYEIFEKLKPELAADYKKHLASLQGSTTTTSADLSTPRSVEAIVKQLLQERENKQWQISLPGKNVKIREQAENLVKFLLWTDPIVKTAVSAQPYTALAWSGVSLLLPVGDRLF